MELNTFSYVFFAALGLSIALQWWLIGRQREYVARHRDTVPEAFADRIALSAHQKAADYTVAKLGVGRIELLAGGVYLLVWTFGGGLNGLDTLWQQTGWNGIWPGVGVLLSAVVIMSVLDLPFNLYNTFVVEQRFGFNRMTPKLYIVDLLRNLALLLAFGLPLATVVLWLMQSAGALWWVYVWAVWMGFSLFMLWAYPAFIAPLFNKFSPLDDEALRQRIEKLLQRTGFTSRGIFVMDGSTRSSHGNAYFTGLGENKRIVFFDTLLKSLEADEVEAVLAHELGHFKRKHILKRIVSMALLSLGGLALLGWLMQQNWFYTGLGVNNPSVHMALLLFIMVFPLFSVYFQPLFAYFSRKHEFEADDFAAQQSNPRDLVNALVKLYEENASTLTPDPVYSAFHDSHPPAPVRVAHLAAKMPTSI
jgi:STE24 endopeptidase